MRLSVSDRRKPYLLSSPELLDGSNQVRAVRLANHLKRAGGSFLSELPVQSAREGLLLRFAALEGGISHDLSGTRAAQVSFGRCCGALHPPMPELLDVGGQGSRAWGLDLWRGWLQSNRRAWGIGAGRQGCQEGDRRNS